MRAIRRSIACSDSIGLVEGGITSGAPLDRPFTMVVACSNNLTLVLRVLAFICSMFCLLLERVKGIEPSSQPWEGHILPLNHTRERPTELCIVKRHGRFDK